MSQRTGTRAFSSSNQLITTWIGGCKEPSRSVSMTRTMCWPSGVRSQLRTSGSPVPEICTTDGAPNSTFERMVTAAVANMPGPTEYISSDAFRADGKSVEVNGDLTIKGVTRPVVLQGILTGPITDGYGGERLGLELETTVDRTEFGLNWNAPLPGGDFMLGNDVTIRGAFELKRAED